MNATTILKTSTLGLLIATAAVLAAPVARPVQACGVPEDYKPAPRAIDLAICLDTSGSMSGLLNSTKQKLWDIVNDLAMAEPTPKLRVALLTYGSPAPADVEGDRFVVIPRFGTISPWASSRRLMLGTKPKS